MDCLPKRHKWLLILFILISVIVNGCAVTNNPEPSDLPTEATSENTETTPSETPKEWELIWSDEFDGETGSSVDSEKWTIEVGNNNGWGNSELQYYTGRPENLSIQDGSLVIKALKEEMEGFQCTSARIKTRGKFKFTYGKVEMSAKLPYGHGIWPAFWMLGADFGSNPWPDCGEIDIMEFIGRQPDTIYGTLHGPEYYGSMGLQNQIKHKTDIHNEFHTYGIEWEENNIKWYFDGQLFHTVSKDKMLSSYTWVFDHDFFMLLNLAVGGNWPQRPNDKTEFPQSYVIDYVRVYQ